VVPGGGVEFQHSIDSVQLIENYVSTPELAFDRDVTLNMPLTVESWNRLLQEIKGFAELFDHSEDEQMAA